MKNALNTIAVITLPIWWPVMVAIECVQIACGADLKNLVGPFIFDKLPK
jgi:hypothetical protein